MTNGTKKRKFVDIDYVLNMLNANMNTNDITMQLSRLPVRQPKPEPPEGGISICAAGRKYRIAHPTISRWVARGLVPVILRTKNEVYISESHFAELAKKYKENPGQGKRNL